MAASPSKRRHRRSPRCSAAAGRRARERRKAAGLHLPGDDRHVRLFDDLRGTEVATEGAEVYEMLSGDNTAHSLINVLIEDEQTP